MTEPRSRVGTGTGNPRRLAPAVAVTAIALPLLVGAVVALALAVAGDARALRVQLPLVTVAILTGLAVSVVAAAVVGVRVAMRRRRAAVTQAHDAGRALEHAAHRRFLSRLDHELKNPVTAVRAAAAGLSSDPQGVERARLTDVVDTQTARLAALVADLRKLGDIESQPIEQERVDVAVVVTDAVEDLRARLDASRAPREITLTLPQVPWPLPAVTGDMDLLYLAVSNVLGNAVKFSPSGSAIEVRGSEHDGRVEIEVADAGMGIPEAEVAGVFDELARGEHARGIPGSGIGLALVRTIVERHGGTVTLRSRHGSGTVVRIALPMAVSPRAASENVRTW